jgi:hypothetical protein
MPRTVWRMSAQVGGVDHTSGRRAVVEVVATCLVALWIVGVTVITQVGAWLIEQYLLATGRPEPAWAWPAAAWVSAVLVAVPAVVLAMVARRRSVRAAGRIWALSAVVAAIAGSVRAVPVEQNDAYLALLAAASVVIALALRAFGRRIAHDVSSGRIGDRWHRPGTPTALTSGVAAGIAVLLPWLWVGALGGILETILALAAAFAVGWLATVLLTARWLDAPLSDRHRARPCPTGRTGRRRDRSGVGRLVTNALVAGVALAEFAAGIGGIGIQIALLVMLPPLAFLASAQARRRAIVLTLALAVVGPLAFVEPAQTSALLGAHDVGYWTAVGGIASWLIAIVLGTGALLWVALRRRRTHVATSTDEATVTAGLNRNGRWRWQWAVAVTAVAAAGVVYPVAGHPGFFGHRLFVVMRTQADLADLAAITNPSVRRAAVYQRLIRTAEDTQAPIRSTLRRWHLSFAPYYLVNGLVVDGGPGVRAWLAQRSDVDRVLLDPTLRPIPSNGAPIDGRDPAPAGPEWNVSLIGADRVWTTGDTGRGIVIGSSDSGVDGQHPALRASFRGGEDSWYDPWNHTRTPVDHDGHGTHTMGSAVGAGGIGVAPGAQWMACVNLDRNLGNPSFYLDCLQFLLAPFGPGGDAFHGDPRRGADIATNSWGCPTQEGCDLRSLQPAIDALTMAGVFVVASAGNEGPRCGSIDDPPAPYPDTFTVGAVNRARRVAGFSSRGPAVSRPRSTGVAGGNARAPKPDLVAPGIDVVSSLPGGGYGPLDGTSMATPQVAGVVALMWSANPTLRGDVARTAQILRSTTTPATGDGACVASDETGAGLVDAPAAVGAALAKR